MAVRPVDSLTMVPRLNEAGRHVRQHEEQPFAFQHVLGSTMQERAARERAQVRQPEKAEQPAIQQQGQGRKGGQEPQGRGGRRPLPAAKPHSAPGNGSRLDVKV